MKPLLLVAALLALLAAAAVSPGSAQTAKPDETPREQVPPPPEPAIYKPPLRGAPGGRVGGASRSAVRSPTPLPVIELLAPADHAGVSATGTPTLYFYVSRPVAWPTQFTISAPRQPAPVLEVTIPSPRAPGIYPLRLADWRVRLQPGIEYNWSVSVVIDPHAWSRNIVASATILVAPTAADDAARAASPARRAALFAAAGLWYDAIGAAVAAEAFDRHAALDALIRQVGLTRAAAYEAGR